MFVKKYTSYVECTDGMKFNLGDIVGVTGVNGGEERGVLVSIVDNVLDGQYIIIQHLSSEGNLIPDDCVVLRKEHIGHIFHILGDDAWNKHVISVILEEVELVESNGTTRIYTGNEAKLTLQSGKTRDCIIVDIIYSALSYAKLTGNVKEIEKNCKLVFYLKGKSSSDIKSVSLTNVAKLVKK